MAPDDPERIEDLQDLVTHERREAKKDNEAKRNRENVRMWVATGMDVAIRILCLVAVSMSLYWAMKHVGSEIAETRQLATATMSAIVSGMLGYLVGGKAKGS